MRVQAGVTKTERGVLNQFHSLDKITWQIRCYASMCSVFETNARFSSHRNFFLHDVRMFGTAGVFLLGVMVGALVLKIAVNRIREDVVTFPVRHDDEEL